MQYLITEDRNVYTIGDIYNQNKTDDKMMLSPYPADFWKPYRDNHNYFDRRFKVLYKSFFPYDQEETEGRESVADDFRFDVYAHLMANDKRYSELFRINTIADNDAYSLTNNVDYTETYEEESGRDIEFNKGSQTDTEDLEHTKGAETDTEDLSTTYGAHDTTATNTISAYNESGYSPKDKDVTESGTHEDTGDNSRTYGQRIDSEDNSRTYGARQDTIGETGSKSSTMRKVGNMGVQTVDDMLLKHWDNWNLFDFYKLIFEEIARDLLRGC